MRQLGVVVACVAISGCFLPPRQTPVGGVDGGPDAPGGNTGYEFPGCANEDYGCPRLPTFYCAAEAIRRDHAACVVDDDCELVTVAPGCTGYGSCDRPAVAKGRGADFQATLRDEIDTYCAGNGGCATAGICGESFGQRAVCRGNTCATVNSTFIGPPAMLSEAACRWTPPTAMCPPSLNGGCLVLHRKGAPPAVVLSKADLGDDSFHFMPLVTDEFLFFTTYRSTFAPPGPSRYVAMDAQGGPLYDLLSLPVGMPINLIGAPAWDPAYGHWFIDDLGPLGSPSRDVRVALASGGTVGLASSAHPGATGATAGLARGSDYLVAHADGLYSYHSTGRARLVEQAGIIYALAANEDHVVFSACAATPAYTCHVYRYDFAGHSTTALFGPVSEDLRSVAIAGGTVFALSGRSLFQVPLAGGAVQVRYAGEAFPQHSGTLLSGSLRAEGDKLYLSQICHPDTDLPEYGTVVLDLEASTANWLNLHPDFPLLPQVQPRFAYSDYPWVNAHGLYTWEQ